MIVLEGRKYFTLAEAAQVLRRHYSTVYNWTVQNRIAFHQPWPGAKILIPDSEIMRLKGRRSIRDSDKL